jgi:hypothetical protein
LQSPAIKASPNKQKRNLGTFITSWIYKPPKSNKFLYAALGVFVSLIFFTLSYGEQLLPWLKRVPAVAIYFFIFLIPPIARFVSGLNKEQQWTLYENGYMFTVRGGQEQQAEKTGYWTDFTTCSYSGIQVKLMPKSNFRLAVKISTAGNVMEVYSICRERIARSQALLLERPAALG